MQVVFLQLGSTLIGAKETSAELEARLAQLGVDAVLESLDSLQRVEDASGDRGTLNAWTDSR